MPNQHRDQFGNNVNVGDTVNYMQNDYTIKAFCNNQKGRLKSARVFFNERLAEVLTYPNEDPEYPDELNIKLVRSVR